MRTAVGAWDRGLSRPLDQYVEMVPGAPWANTVNLWACTTEGVCGERLFDSIVLLLPTIIVLIVVALALWSLDFPKGPKWLGWVVAGSATVLLWYVVSGWVLPQAAAEAYTFDSLVWGLGWRTLLHLFGAALVPALVVVSYWFSGASSRKGTLVMTVLAVGVLLGVRELVTRVPDLTTPLAERVDGVWREIAETWTWAVPLGFIDGLVQWGTQPAVIVTVGIAGVVAAVIKPAGFLATPVAAVLTTATVLVVGAALLGMALMALFIAGAVFAAYLMAMLMFGLAVSWVVQK